MMFYVYEHIRPDTNAVFYVGKGKDRRAQSAKYRNKHWHNTVAKADGFSVRMVAENVDEELAFLIEVERIDQLRRLGVKLCNLTDGGEGLSGYTPSEETRQKLRARVITDEARRKLSAAGMGRTHSEETKRRMSAAGKGRTHTEETKLKMRGHFVSEETKQKISAAAKGRIVTDDAKRKISEAQKGRVHSEASIQKRAAAISGGRNPAAITVLFDGKTFTTVKALAKYAGLEYGAVKYRVRVNPAKWGYEVLGFSRGFSISNRDESL